MALLYLIVMSNGTHGMTVSKVSKEADTAQVYVPAEVQREQGISIDDTIEVTIEDLPGIFESITFENPQTGSDRVTVPAEIVRKADIERGEQYPVMFEKVEDSDWKETNESLEEFQDEMEDEGIGVDEEESQDEEEEEETIADLFQ